MTHPPQNEGRVLARRGPCVNGAILGASGSGAGVSSDTTVRREVQPRRYIPNSALTVPHDKDLCGPGEVKPWVGPKTPTVRASSGGLGPSSSPVPLYSLGLQGRTTWLDKAHLKVHS